MCLTDNTDSSVWNNMILSSIASLHTAVSVAVQIVVLFCRRSCAALQYVLVHFGLPCWCFVAQQANIQRFICCQTYIAKPVERQEHRGGEEPARPLLDLLPEEPGVGSRPTCTVVGELLPERVHRCTQGVLLFAPVAVKIHL